MTLKLQIGPISSFFVYTYLLYKPLINYLIYTIYIPVLLFMPQLYAEQQLIRMDPLHFSVDQMMATLFLLNLPSNNSYFCLKVFASLYSQWFTVITFIEIY